MTITARFRETTINNNTFHERPFTISTAQACCKCKLPTDLSQSRFVVFLGLEVHVLVLGVQIKTART